MAVPICICWLKRWCAEWKQCANCCCWWGGGGAMKTGWKSYANNELLAKFNLLCQVSGLVWRELVYQREKVWSGPHYSLAPLFFATRGGCHPLHILCDHKDRGWKITSSNGWTRMMFFVNPRLGFVLKGFSCFRARFLLVFFWGYLWFLRVVLKGWWWQFEIPLILVFVCWFNDLKLWNMLARKKMFDDDER